MKQIASAHGYAADTKAYIDSKIAEISAAIVSK